MGDPNIKKTNKLTYLTIALLILLLIDTTMTSIKSAASPIIVKGNVYIDGVITEPGEVSLMLEHMYYADIDGGRYYFVFEDEEPGTTGSFMVFYKNRYYYPPETVTLEENHQYSYNVDLHIETTNGRQPPEEPTNVPPVANAGGPYYEIVNNQIEFNGSKSIAHDGTITSFNWDFGDSETGSGIKTAHTYLQTGKYLIKLTVTDNKGITDISYTYAYITATPNIPPTNLTIIGPKNGNIQTKYEYSIQAIDLDNDSLQYTIDWDDETQTSSNFLKNGKIFTINHSYNEPGIFKIMAIAMDEKNFYSETVELTVLIDLIYCENIGYMVDFTGDQIYDLFHANATGIETIVEKNNGNYLIDSDNDGEYDYKYNPATCELLEFTNQDLKDQLTTQNSYTIQLGPEIIIALAVVVIAVILISLIMIVKKQRHEKVKMYYVKEKKIQKPKETDKEIIEKREKSEDIRDIENRIDKILSKKK